MPNHIAVPASLHEAPAEETLIDRQAIYELSWRCPSSGKAVIRIPDGTILDCNPAAEAFLGMGWAEIVGRSVHEFIPPSESSRATNELLRVADQPVQYEGFHLLTVSGRKVPIAISSSGVVKLSGGIPVAVIEFRDVSLEVQQEYRLATQTWALSAYAAAVALGQQNAACDLFGAICAAIVTEPTYVLAWVGIAEHGPSQPIRAVARAGPGSSILDGLSLSWSGDGPSGEGPTPVAIRTEHLQAIQDLH